MKVVIVGSGRVGSTLAQVFDEAGHEVIIVDQVTRAFDRLPSTFRGSAVRGNGTDEDTLRRAGAVDADLFLALTEGDNRNVMAAQVAREHLGAKAVVAKVNDPVRADAYAHLGIPALCRTNLLVDSVLGFLGLPVTPRPGIIVESPAAAAPGAGRGVAGLRTSGAGVDASTGATFGRAIAGGPDATASPSSTGREA